MKRSRRLQGLSPSCFPVPAWRQKKSIKDRAKVSSLWKSDALQPCPEALASGAVVIGDSGGIWVFDVVGTREASMHSGAFSPFALSLAGDSAITEQPTKRKGKRQRRRQPAAAADLTDFEVGPCKAARWSEVETGTLDDLDDLVDLGSFDPADFEVGAGPCEPGELACD